jgi:hypothetical protein
MRTRIVITGIAAGFICLTALWFPWYMMDPAGVAPDWAYADEAAVMAEWIGIAVPVFCGLTLFVFGWAAARWAWAADWRESLLAGAGAGSIAGCLVYNLLGAFHFGLAGQKPILENFTNQVTEAEGMALLADAISESAVQMNMGLLYLLALCVLAGGLGGLASAVDAGDTWGKPPRKTDTWLCRLSAYGLTLSGAVWLTISLTAIQLLQEPLINTLAEYELRELTSHPFLILPMFHLAMTTLMLLPMSITWGWAIREWKGAGLWRVTYALWLLTTTLLAVWMLRGFTGTGGLLSIPLFAGLALPLNWTVVLISIGTGLWLGYLSKPVSGSPLTLRASDWAGYAVTQGILGGTQFFVSVPAYALVLVVITITNIPHLTQSGIVEESLMQQIRSLSSVLSWAAFACMILSLLGGMLFALAALLARKFLKISPTQPGAVSAEIASSRR